MAENCHIVSSEKVGGRTSYTIKFTEGGEERLVRKHYTDFLNLDQEEWVRQLPAQSRPKLPPKGCFGLRHRLNLFQFNAKREAGLQNYLEQLLCAAAPMLHPFLVNAQTTAAGLEEPPSPVAKATPSTPSDSPPDEVPTGDGRPRAKIPPLAISAALTAAASSPSSDCRGQQVLLSAEARERAGRARATWTAREAAAVTPQRTTKGSNWPTSPSVGDASPSMGGASPSLGGASPSLGAATSTILSSDEDDEDDVPTPLAHATRDEPESFDSTAMMAAQPPMWREQTSYFHKESAGQSGKPLRGGEVGQARATTPGAVREDLEGCKAEQAAGEAF